MAFHHDQARALHRAHAVIDHLVIAGALELPPGSRIVAMPIRRDVGDAVHRHLVARLGGADAPARLTARIGLGLDPAVEVARLPLQFTRTAVTARDGSLLGPLDPTHFATIEGDRIVGHIDAGREQVGIGRLDQEPQYVAGAGFPSSPASVPSIVAVLAIGHTTAQALSRGCSVFDAFGLDQSLFVVRIAKLKPIDGQLLRITLESARDAADPPSRDFFETGLGGRDDSLRPDRWHDLDPAARAVLDAGEPAQVTTDGSGRPQVWNADVDPCPYWADDVQ